MDLFGGYGSGSESEESQASKNISSSDTQQNVDEGNNQRPHVTKQKRRLLSLNAVLPSDIFERLSRPTDQIGDSSSDEDDNNNINSRLKNKNMKGQRHANNRHNEMKRTEVQSLLSGLKGSKLKNDKMRTTNSKNSSAEYHNIQEENAGNTAEKMGFAFTNVSVVKTKKLASKSGEGIISVHDKPRITSANAEDERKYETASKDSRRSNAVETSERNIHGEISNLVTCANLKRKDDSTGATVPSLRRNPLVSAAPNKEPSSSNSLNELSQRRQKQNAAVDTATATTTTKMSKRDMQRALRAGNFHQFDNAVINSSSSSSAVIDIHQEVNSYTPSDSTRAMTNARQASSSIKNSIATEIYDPKTGSMVGESINSGNIDGAENNKALQQKLRSKHQIHQLVHSAKVLEAHRRNNPHMNGYSGKRADAKRKYGW